MRIGVASNPGIESHALIGATSLDSGNPEGMLPSRSRQWLSAGYDRPAERRYTSLTAAEYNQRSYGVPGPD